MRSAQTKKKTMCHCWNLFLRLEMSHRSPTGLRLLFTHNVCESNNEHPNTRSLHEMEMPFQKIHIDMLDEYYWWHLMHVWIHQCIREVTVGWNSIVCLFQKMNYITNSVVWWDKFVTIHLMCSFLLCIILVLLNVLFCLILCLYVEYLDAFVCFLYVFS